MRGKLALVVLLAVAAVGVLSTAAGATTRTSGSLASTTPIGWHMSLGWQKSL